MLPIEISTSADGRAATAAAERSATIQARWQWPLVAYALLAAGYLATIGHTPGTWQWFNYHPLCMLVAFVAMAGNAILIKKIGGYENTKIHSILMTSALAFAFFGWYVIYTNKEMLGKAHLLTMHGKLGCTVLISYLLVGLVGGVFLHPDFGVWRNNQNIRFCHKVAGKVLTALAWSCSVLGALRSCMILCGCM